MNETLISVLLIVFCAVGMLGIVLLLKIIIADDGDSKKRDGMRYYVLRMNPENGKLQIQRYRGSLKLWK